MDLMTYAMGPNDSVHLTVHNDLRVLGLGKQDISDINSACIPHIADQTKSLSCRNFVPGCHIIFKSVPV